MAGHWRTIWGNIVFPDYWNVKTTHVDVVTTVKHMMYSNVTMKEEINNMIFSIFSNIVTSHKLNNSLDDFVTVMKKRNFSTLHLESSGS